MFIIQNFGARMESAQPNFRLGSSREMLCIIQECLSVQPRLIGELVTMKENVSSMRFSMLASRRTVVHVWLGKENAMYPIALYHAVYYVYNPVEYSPFILRYVYLRYCHCSLVILRFCLAPRSVRLSVPHRHHV
ncbi:hypothetical protein ANCCAN_13123 [Ancylostoma caninum]|uniref:Uncharacterized protein n=1 Tax=Ancylostoma caninum TaxID=29170 RepID=A0A368G959_ANCCA|nr:hypothetical protein ANCCAN_13123 [Ancylostoma caninum]